MTFLTGNMTIKEKMIRLKLKFTGKEWGRGPGGSGSELERVGDRVGALAKIERALREKCV